MIRKIFAIPFLIIYLVKVILGRVIIVWPVKYSILLWYLLKRSWKTENISFYSSFIVYSTMTLAMIFVSPVYLLLSVAIMGFFVHISRKG